MDDLMRAFASLSLSVVVLGSSACSSMRDASAHESRVGRAAAESSTVVTRRVLADMDDGHRVGYPGNTSPSPDGRLLAIADQTTGDLLVQDLTTNEVRHVTRNATRWENGGPLIPRFSPDGKRIAFEWEPPKHDYSEIRVINLDGSNERTIEQSKSRGIAETDPIDWSPDGKRILATRFNKDGSTQILLVETDALRAPRVLKSVDWREPRQLFSPDGRYVAYDHPPRTDSNNRAIYVIEVATGRETQILDALSDNRLLAWTRDGLIYASDRSGTPAAWSLRMTDGRAVGNAKLVKSDLWRSSPVGMASASGALFYSVEVGGTNIFVAPTDRTTGNIVGTPTPLAPTPLGNLEDGFVRLDWSPDGKAIAYSAANDAGNTKQEVIRSIETGKTREFPLLGRQSYFVDHRWLVDGTGLVMLSAGVFYRFDAQSGALTEIARAAIPTGAPLYRFGGISADGTQLIYTVKVARDSTQAQSRGCAPCDVRVVAQDIRDGATHTTADFGTKLGNKTTNAGTLSYDGSSLALIAPEWGSPSPAGEIIVLPVHGGEPRVVASHIQFNGAGHGPHLAWSRDGRWIYFTAATPTGNEARIMKVSSSGGAPEDTGIHGEVIGPIRFAPDGRIAYAAGRRRLELWAMDHLPKTAAASSNNSGR
jgi:Tol biopolymer transport system component